MLRGCQKKIVFIKNTGSKIFDEAYFIISGNEDAARVPYESMVDEAKRIIKEATFDDELLRKEKIKAKIIKLGVPFLTGALFSGFIALLIFLI